MSTTTTFATGAVRTDDNSRNAYRFRGMEGMTPAQANDMLGGLGYRHRGSVATKRGNQRVTYMRSSGDVECTVTFIEVQPR